MNEPVHHLQLCVCVCVCERERAREIITQDTMIQHPRSSPSSVVLHPFFLSSLLLSLRPNSPHTHHNHLTLSPALYPPCTVTAAACPFVCVCVCVCVHCACRCVCVCVCSPVLSPLNILKTHSPLLPLPPATRCLSFFPSPDASHPSILTPPFTLSVDAVAPPTSAR